MRRNLPAATLLALAATPAAPAPPDCQEIFAARDMPVGPWQLQGMPLGQAAPASSGPMPGRIATAPEQRAIARLAGRAARLTDLIEDGVHDMIANAKQFHRRVERSIAGILTLIQYAEPDDGAADHELDDVLDAFGLDASPESAGHDEPPGLGGHSAAGGQLLGGPPYCNDLFLARDGVILSVKPPPPASSRDFAETFVQWSAAAFLAAVLAAPLGSGYAAAMVYGKPRDGPRDAG